MGCDRRIGFSRDEVKVAVRLGGKKGKMVFFDQRH